MNVERDGSFIKVSFEGTFDENTEKNLEHIIAEELCGVKKLSFDLEGIKEISYAGLSLFLHIQKIMNEQGIMYIEHASEQVEWLCKVHNILCLKSDKWADRALDETETIFERDF